MTAWPGGNTLNDRTDKREAAEKLRLASDNMSLFVVKIADTITAKLKLGFMVRLKTNKTKHIYGSSRGSFDS